MTMPEDRFPKQLFSQEWDQKPRRGRQRKTWGRVIDDLFVSLGLDKAEWLEDIERGESSLAYIRPQKLLDALILLKANNPLYADIVVNEQWVEEAMVNDEELCKYLVEQDDEEMDTECEQLENDGCDSNSPPNVAVNVESEPMECSSIPGDGDEFSTAFQLKARAHQNSFTIRDVPYDGNCIFSSISYQLQTTGVCNVNSNELRQKVADHLQANAALYRDFLCQPVPSEDDDYNADTEQPTTEDQYINSVVDPQMQTELRWQKYVKCLRQGAWGDHITLLTCLV